MRSCLEKANAEGRNFLTEYEGYQFLASLGLDVPKNELVADAHSLDARMDAIAAEYPDRLVLKISSPDIHHKTEIGGVAVVENTPDALSGAFDEILRRAREARPDAKIDGVLVMEFVEVEHELLAGLIDDATFGHILTVGRGGTLTEIFRDVAMRPAPADAAEVEAMLRSLKTCALLKGYRGAKGADVARLAKFISRVSLLANQNCYIKGSDPEMSQFEIEEFEINPLAAAKSGRVVPLDCIVRFRPAGKAARDAEPDATHLDKLFHPKTIALVGASETTDKMGGSILKSLIDSGAAKIFPINPKRDTLMGIKTYASVSAAPKAVDLAVLAVPAKATPPVVAECARAKAKMTVVISGGFGETGEEGKKMEAEMAAAAKKSGMRLIGPNCMGVYFEPTNFSTFFLSPEKTIIPRRDVNNFTVLSQSGAVSVQLVQLARNVGVRAIVSYGNMIDVDVADLMAYFDGDEGTDVVGLYIEGLTNGRKFINAARRMRKPVVITKGGRSHAGGAATVSHTGSIAGDYEVARAVFKAAGLVEAETIEEFADYVKAFAFLKGRAAKGRRVGIISNAGGLGVLAADAAAGTCLEMAKFGGATVEKVAAEAGGYVVIGNPVDLGPGVTDEGFVRAAGHLVEDAGVDALVLLPGIQPYAMRPENLVDGIIELHGRCGVPMVVGITPAARCVPLFDKLESARIPHYDTPERAVRALAACVSYHTAR